MPEEYVPDRGHLIWLSLEPHAGREQAGRRPVLTISPASYNARSDLALFCPVTSRVKGYPFEVPVPGGSPVAGVILADQVKSLDWRSRNAAFIAAVPPETLTEVVDLLSTLLGR